MIVSKISLTEGYLIVEEPQVDKREITTSSGLTMSSTENNDEFILYGKVVSSAVTKFPVNSHVIFNLISAFQFSDMGTKHYLLKEQDIIGTYEAEA